MPPSDPLFPIKQRQKLGFLKAILQVLSHEFAQNNPFSMKQLQEIWKYLSEHFTKKSWAWPAYKARITPKLLNLWVNKNPKRHAWIKAGVRKKLLIRVTREISAKAPLLLSKDDLAQLTHHSIKRDRPVSEWLDNPSDLPTFLMELEMSLRDREDNMKGESSWSKPLIINIPCVETMFSQKGYFSKHKCQVLADDSDESSDEAMPRTSLTLNQTFILPDLHPIKKKRKSSSSMLNLMKIPAACPLACEAAVKTQQKEEPDFVIFGNVDPCGILDEHGELKKK